MEDEMNALDAKHDELEQKRALEATGSDAHVTGDAHHRVKK